MAVLGHYAPLNSITANVSLVNAGVTDFSIMLHVKSAGCVIMAKALAGNDISI